MFPESLKFWTSDKQSTVVESVVGVESTGEVGAKLEAKTNKEIVPELDADQLEKIEVGQTKKQILAALGPSVDVDTGEALADTYIKDGKIYDVLYFRTNVNGLRDIRALLFEDDKLIGIGWTELK
tara:strand:- start:24 stop:398 length:375 start_codon:yes stop_codon:yes gene_type:complete